MNRRALLLLAVALAVGGCTRAPERTPAPGADSTSAQGSLFELPFPLTDAQGRTRHLSEFGGQPFVATMIYTHCTSVCPRVTADLQRLDRALPDAVRARTRYLLFSLDPERDTPAALTEFAHDHGLDSTRWTLLAASPDDMRTLAAVLDVRFRPDTNGEIAHSAVFAVADHNGVIRHRQKGTADNLAELIEAVSTAR